MPPVVVRRKTLLELRHRKYGLAWHANCDSQASRTTRATPSNREQSCSVRYEHEFNTILHCYRILFIHRSSNDFVVPQARCFGVSHVSKRRAIESSRRFAGVTFARPVRDYTVKARLLRPVRSGKFLSERLYMVLELIIVYEIY